MLPGNKGQRGRGSQLRVPGENDSDHQTNATTGVAYIRWGRTSCPGDAQLLYKGKTRLGLGCKNINRQIRSVDSITGRQ